jgi:hypothetical protein
MSLGMNRFLLILAMVNCNAAAVSQGNVKAADTIVAPSLDLVVPDAVRAKLSGAADFEAFLSLPNQDRVVVYDTVRDKPDTADFMDNHPHVAILRGGDIVMDLDLVSLAPLGPVQFHGMAVWHVSRDTVLTVFAFRLAADGSGTLFLFVGEKSGEYKVVGTLVGAQAQVRFKDNFSGDFEFWTADGQFSTKLDEQCVWCAKYYKRIAYVWRDGQLRQLLTFRDRQSYQPETFDRAPFVSSK